MIAIDGATWRPGGKDTFIENSKLQVQVTSVSKDANGNALATEDKEETRGTIYVINLGPLLTPDWECHKKAWLQGWPPGVKSSVGERTLASVKNAILFSIKSDLSNPQQGIQSTGETIFGYDESNGKLVLMESRSSGTRNGEPFSTETILELVSVGTVPSDEGSQTGITEGISRVIASLEREPVTNPPASLVEYEYEGQRVYYLPPTCCDIFSNLYGGDGAIIGHPDGGITGGGDGRVPDFLEARTNGKLIWRDPRTYDAALVQVPAPIESVELLILETFPVRYNLEVVSGLPDACFTFAGYRTTRDGDVIRAEVVNWKPADSGVACAAVYTTVKTTISLGSDFDPGRTYIADVNGTVLTFQAQ